MRDGRYAAETLLMEQGVGIRTVMEILGHSQMSVTKRYLHVSTPMAQEAMRRMGDALWDRPEKAEKRATETATETGPTRAARRKRRRRVV